MEESQETELSSESPIRKKSGGILRLVPWAILILAVAGILVARASAPENDHALANILTVGLGLLAWISAVLGLLWTQSLRPAGLLLALAPFLASGTFLAMNRFERLDSELVPQFVPRWQEEAVLPTTKSGGEGVSEVVSEMFAATDHDFPQFLGQNRNAIVDTAISGDWDANPPKVIWKQPIGDGWSGFATQGSVAITMEQRDEEEWVTAYSIADGSLIWKYTIPAMHTTVPGGTGPRSTPTISNNKVYASSAVGELVCLDLENGQEIWTQDLLKLSSTTQEELEAGVAWGRSGSPLIVGDKLFVPLGGKTGDAKPLVALNAETGEELWQAGEGQMSYSSPLMVTIAGVPQIVLVSEDKAASYAPETGKTLWDIPWDGKANANPAVAHAVVVDDSKLLIAKGYSHGSMLLDVQLSGEDFETEVVWREERLMKTKFTTAVLRNGYAYGLSDGILECIDVNEGKRKWKKGRYKHGQLLLLKDKLLILAESGDLVLVAANPNKFEELQEMPVINGVSWNTMALSGDRLLIRNSDEAACVQLPILDGDAETSSSTSKASESESE